MFSATAFGYKIFVIVLFFLHIFPLSVAFAQEGRYQGWRMGPGMIGSWGMGWFGGIFMMAFWILIIIGLIFLIKLLVKTGNKIREDGERGSKAMAVLKERYASGEIDKTQFETMKRDLADRSY